MPTRFVEFEVVRPLSFERYQVVMRLVILLVLAMLGASLAWTFGLLYLVLPALACFALSKRSAERFFAQDAPTITRLLRWILAFYSYLAMLTDTLPTSEADLELRGVKLTITPHGTPTPAAALARLVTSIPAVIFLFVLGFIGAIVWVLSMVMVLVKRDVPESLYGLQLGVMRYQASMLAYHASLVDEYPPFQLDTHTAGAEPEAPSPDPGVV